ncbi:MAG: hypothetical protein PHS50_13335 [Kiritimatiellae bacterium]|jgi:hypothetical protein|nr:hypothetical protein [Kiritimatiellia bacterium]
MFEILLGMVTAVRLVQLWKALVPMAVTGQPFDVTGRKRWWPRYEESRPVIVTCVPSDVYESGIGWVGLATTLPQPLASGK